MIECKGIHKSYGSLEVLKDVHLAIQPAEIVSIMGPSGAGKSTLLHIIGTLDQADSGQVIIHGQSIGQLNHKALSGFRNEHIGFVFQFHHLLPEFSAVENVSMPGLIGGKDAKRTQHRAKELLVALGLEDRMHHKPNELSGGEQQRVAIARALINDPDIILADEPSGNLDTDNARELHELFLRLREERKQTFLIVTHNDELASIADRTVLMRDGQIIN